MISDELSSLAATIDSIKTLANRFASHPDSSLCEQQSSGDSSPAEEGTK
jgi:hypothetical protein